VKKYSIICLFVWLACVAFTGCDASFTLSADLSTCTAQIEESKTYAGEPDLSINLGTAPVGTRTRCFQMRWPADSEGFIEGFRIDSDTSEVIQRTEVFQVVTKTTVEKIFNVSDDIASTGFECPGVMGDNRLVWWFQSEGTDWRLPVAGTRAISTGARLLIRVIYQDALATDSSHSAAWLTTNSPSHVVKTTTLYNPFWLLKGAFSLPSGESVTKKSFTIDLATRLMEETIHIQEVRFDMGPMGTQATLAIERESGEQVCVDHRSSLSASTPSTSPLLAPLALHKGDLVHVACQWDTSQSSSEISWGMQDELCRAVITYRSGEDN
jgi:hypothetical protein